MILTFILGAVIGATVGVAVMAVMACLTINQFEKMKEDDQ